MTITDLDRPPPGWHVYDVIRRTARSWSWVAYMTSVRPDERRGPGETCWVVIPGKHRTREAAWAALEDMLATRH